MTVDSTIITAFTTIFGMIITYIIARGTNKKDLTESRIENLTSAEQKFRGDILAELRIYKEEIKELTANINSLREENSELVVSNASLVSKVNDLTRILERLNIDTTSTLTCTTQTTQQHIGSPDVTVTTHTTTE